MLNNLDHLIIIRITKKSIDPVLLHPLVEVEVIAVVEEEKEVAVVVVVLVQVLAAVHRLDLQADREKNDQ